VPGHRLRQRALADARCRHVAVADRVRPARQLRIARALGHGTQINPSGQLTITDDYRRLPIARFGLDAGYDNPLLRQAAVLSTVQVKDLLARELDPAGEVVVAFGDRAAVTKAFADAGIANAQLVEPSDK
jgi:hypothetical protein